MLDELELPPLTTVVVPPPHELPVVSVEKAVPLLVIDDDMFELPELPSPEYEPVALYVPSPEYVMLYVFVAVFMPLLVPLPDIVVPDQLDENADCDTPLEVMSLLYDEPPPV